MNVMIYDHVGDISVRWPIKCCVGDIRVNKMKGLWENISSRFFHDE